MRPIKFRGKRLDNGEWVCGSYVRGYEGNRHFITQAGPGHMFYEIDLKTLGQYVDQIDLDNKEYYTDDIVGPPGNSRYVIEWNDETFGYNLRDLKTGDYWGLKNLVSMRIVGNKYDNPEMMEVAEDERSD